MERCGQHGAFGCREEATFTGGARHCLYLILTIKLAGVSLLPQEAAEDVPQPCGRTSRGGKDLLPNGAPSKRAIPDKDKENCELCVAGCPCTNGRIPAVEGTGAVKERLVAHQCSGGSA